jgi:hypothetical protein
VLPSVVPLADEHAAAATSRAPAADNALILRTENGLIDR